MIYVTTNPLPTPPRLAPAPARLTPHILPPPCANPLSPPLVETLTRRSLGTGSRAIIRRVRQRCPKSGKMKACSGFKFNGGGIGGIGGIGGSNTGNAGNGSTGGNGRRGRKGPKPPPFAPGILCAGARELGLDLGGFQAVTIAAAEVSDPPAPPSPP